MSLALYNTITGQSKFFPPREFAFSGSHQGIKYELGSHQANLSSYYKNLNIIDDVCARSEAEEGYCVKDTSCNVT